MASVHTIKLSLSNCFLVRGKQTLLVDTGSPGESKKILSALAALGVRLNDVAGILHTHGHSDHAGSTAELLQHRRIPTAIHPQDAAMVREGKNRTLQPLSLVATMLLPFVDKPFAPFEPDMVLDESFHSDNMMVVHTPGHTAGSVALVLDNGEAIIGDTIMGGFLGGVLMPSKPDKHYFAEDIIVLHESIKRLMALPAERFYVGHGGPLLLKDVQQRFKYLL
jgi:glyoxylase-like metal-dependent hydrolase (beta-lactamase superfamily II)